MPRLWCLLFGHRWNLLRPRHVQGSRIEDCTRCFAVRPHVPPDGRLGFPFTLSQQDLDGNARPVAVRRLTPAELAALRAKRETLLAEADALRESARTVELAGNVSQLRRRR